MGVEAFRCEFGAEAPSPPGGHRRVNLPFDSRVPSAASNLGPRSEAPAPTFDWGLLGLPRQPFGSHEPDRASSVTGGVLRPRLPGAPAGSLPSRPHPGLLTLSQLHCRWGLPLEAAVSREPSPNQLRRPPVVPFMVTAPPGRGTGAWTRLEVGAPGPPELALLEEFGGRKVSGNHSARATM